MDNTALKPRAMPLIFMDALRATGQVLFSVLPIAFCFSIVALVPNQFLSTLLTATSSRGSTILGGFIVVVLGFFAIPFFYGLITARIYGLLTHNGQTLRQVVFQVMRRLFSLAFVIFLTTLLALLGSLLLLLPGLFLTLTFIFCIPLMLIEKEPIGAFASIRLSCRIVWGNWWRTCWILASPTLLFIFTSAMLTILLNITDTLAVLFLEISLLTLLIPFMVSLIIIQLGDLQTRYGLKVQEKADSAEHTAT